MSRRRGLPLLVVVLLALAPAGAHAANVRIANPSMGAKTLYFDAAAGEANRVTLTRTSTHLVVQDTGAAPLTSGDATCTADTPQQYRCPLPSNFRLVSVIANLGDMDDRMSGTPSGPAELNGQAGRDILYGTPNADKLSGGLGNDDAYGQGGDDVLSDALASPFDTDGNDLQDGGPGDDQLLGGVGNDVLLGREGQDVLWVANGVETTDGGPGIDAVAADPASGGAGPAFEKDYLLSLDGRANDGYRTAPERWSIGPGVEDLRGTHQDDVLVGDAGINEIAGGSGDDRILPGGGTDSVDAGEDDDTVDAGDGIGERILCGAGDDRATLDAADQQADCETRSLFAPATPPQQPGPVTPTPTPTPPDTTPATVSLSVPRKGARLKNLRRGRVPSMRLSADEAVSATIVLTARARTFRIARAGDVELAQKRLPSATGRRSVKLKVGRRHARRIGRRTKLRIAVVAVDGGGNVTRRSYALKIRR